MVLYLEKEKANWCNFFLICFDAIVAASAKGFWEEKIFKIDLGGGGYTYMCIRSLGLLEIPWTKSLWANDWWQTLKRLFARGDCVLSMYWDMIIFKKINWQQVDVLLILLHICSFGQWKWSVEGRCSFKFAAYPANLSAESDDGKANGGAEKQLLTLDIQMQRIKGVQKLAYLVIMWRQS